MILTLSIVLLLVTRSFEFCMSGVSVSQKIDNDNNNDDSNANSADDNDDDAMAPKRLNRKQSGHGF